MDLRTVFPPKQEGKVLTTDSFSAFGLSLQGSSHSNKETPVPCQDYSDFRYLEQGDLYIAAIADGVGSCELSHWGAYTAVCAVLDSVEAAFKVRNLPPKLILEPSSAQELKKIMLQGFRDAQDAVERKADEGMVMPALCMSTLTLAIYDGENLYFGHVGDDGIVAQMANGNVEMLTTRLKGEEASSVFPLQSGEGKWKFGRSAEKVAGFIMATDGVLDAFVTNRPDYYNVNYNKGVFYPFMKDAMEILAEDDFRAAEKALEKYRQFMLSDSYRTAVTDDLTFVAVVSNKLMKAAQKPKFNVNIWEVISAESNKARKMALRRNPVPLDGLDAMHGSQETEIPDSGDDFQLLLDENSRLKDDIEDIQSREEQLRAAFASAKKKGWIIIAGSCIAALLAGILAGRAFFQTVSKEEYQEVTEAYKLLQDENNAVSAERDILSGDLAAAKKRVDELLASIEQADQMTQQAEGRNQELESQLQVLKEAYELSDEDVMLLIEERNALKALVETVKQAAAEMENAKQAAAEAEAAALDAESAENVAAAEDAEAKAKDAWIRATTAAAKAEQLKEEILTGSQETDISEEIVDAAKFAADEAVHARDAADGAYERAANAVKTLQQKEVVAAAG